MQHEALSGPRPGGARHLGAGEAVPELAGPRQATVLVVEPDADELRRLTRGLSAHGWRVIPVEDGHTAVDWAEVFRPQAIVLSSTLPDYSGREVLGWLRQGEWAGRAALILIVPAGEPASKRDLPRVAAVLERPVSLTALAALLARP